MTLSTAALFVRTFVVFGAAITVWFTANLVLDCWRNRWTGKVRNDASSVDLDRLRDIAHASGDTEAFVATLVDDTTPTVSWPRVVLLELSAALLLASVWTAMYVLTVVVWP